MKVAYADPPYVGMCSRYQHYHPDGLCWDDFETTRRLIERLNRDYPDGWALSCKSDASELAQIIAWAQADGKKVRIASWVKTFHIYRPNVNPSYGWEPVIFKGGRKRTRFEPTVRDFHAERITMKKGLTGAKPPGFNAWVLSLLNARPGDQVDDLFPGTGGMAVAIAGLVEPVLTKGRPSAKEAGGEQR